MANQNYGDAKTAYAEQDKLDELVEINNKIFFKVRFNFVNGHRGPRPGRVHLLLGTAGSGKSTLARSMIGDCAADKKVLLVLSEEDIEDFQIASANQGITAERMKNIHIISELNIPQEIRLNKHKFKKYIEEQVFLIRPDIIFWDNLTTSVTYEMMRPAEQTEYILWLKMLIKNKMKIPLIIVAHTKAGVSDNQPTLIDLDDIRGSKALGNMAEYAYMYQNPTIDGRQYPFIWVRKSRLHRHKGIFLLTYIREKNCFIGDKDIEFETFKKAFNKREKL